MDPLGSKSTRSVEVQTGGFGSAWRLERKVDLLNPSETLSPAVDNGPIGVKVDKIGRSTDLSMIKMEKLQSEIRTRNIFNQIVSTTFGQSFDMVVARTLHERYVTLKKLSNKVLNCKNRQTAVKG